MTSADSLGTLLLSIQLELDLENQDRRDEQRLDEIRSRLIELTKAAEVPATWAVADPMLSAASESILAAGCGHELAVLGDEAWLGPGCGTTRLRRELARRFLAPRKSGIPVSTLVLRNVAQLGDLEQFVQHGVTAIAHPSTSDWSSLRKTPPLPTRFGIWQPPIGARLPLRTKWWSPAPWLVWREIKNTIRRRSTLHLCIDAPRLIGNDEPALDSIAATLRYAAARRNAGQLRIATVAQLASHALQSRAGTPTRSILRPAA
jgi:hypothetical protein